MNKELLARYISALPLVLVGIVMTNSDKGWLQFWGLALLVTELVLSLYWGATAYTNRVVQYTREQIAIEMSIVYHEYYVPAKGEIGKSDQAVRQMFDAAANVGYGVNTDPIEVLFGDK